MSNKKNKTKTILLFGNKGQIGREVEELAAERGCVVYGFDIDNLDITDMAQVTDCFVRHRDVDVVINAAAYTAVDKAEDEVAPSYAVNHAAVKNLALMCRKYDVPLIHLSTDYVFSGEKNTSYSEVDATSPLSIYGKSKLAGEEVLAQNWEKHIILRISWVFGKYGNNFVKTILRLAKEREELRIVGDQYGCPTPARDVARVLIELVERISDDKSSWGIYNYCGSPVTTWYDFTKKIIELASVLNQEKFTFKVKHTHKITTAEYPTKAVRPKNSELLVSKIIDDYNIVRHNWFDYLAEVINAIEM